METRKVNIAVHGLGCGGGGSLSLERAIERLDGIAGVYVNPATHTAYVEFDPQSCDTLAIVQTIKRLGFRPGTAVYRS